MILSHRNERNLLLHSLFPLWNPNSLCTWGYVSIGSSVVFTSVAFDVCETSNKRSTHFNGYIKPHFDICLQVYVRFDWRLVMVKKSFCLHFLHGQEQRWVDWLVLHIVFDHMDSQFRQYSLVIMCHSLVGGSARWVPTVGSVGVLIVLISIFLILHALMFFRQCWPSFLWFCVCPIHVLY